jgi:hypothetical protein
MRKTETINPRGAAKLSYRARHDAPVVNTGNAARLVRQEQPDGSPFKV